jgi:3-hydroxybutyrate dehydrogenase
LAVARSLAAQGSHVVLNGFGEEKAIQSVVSGIESEFGVRALFKVPSSPQHPPSSSAPQGADMTSRKEIVDMVAETQSELGSLDVLVNKAGRQHVSPLAEFPDDMWDAIVGLNLTSNFDTIKAALPMMTANKWGRIINVASAHGIVASANKSAYVAAKHGVMGLTKTVGLETAQIPDVTCNSICPGWVLTPLVQAQVDALALRDGVDDAEAKRRLLAEKQPSGEFTAPEEIGGLAVFLCSDAARNITGTSISADGGWTAV